MKVHLVDGTFELFRHFFAVPAAMDANGQDVGAVRGVLGTVLSMIERGRDPRRGRDRSCRGIVSQRPRRAPKKAEKRGSG
jgi:hypothetical protein